jgi:hypothetical protein
MTWFLYGLLAFCGVCLLTAIALVWAGNGDISDEANASGAPEGDQIHFSQSRSPAD